MHLLVGIKILIEISSLFASNRHFFAQFSVLLGLISFGYSSILLAEVPHPACFPVESAWENIELETVNFANNQNPEISHDGQAITLTFNKFENYLPQFYGFAFLKNDLPNIPKITERSAFEEQFREIKLFSLNSNKVATDNENKTYRFTPPREGIWVIYLVAAINKIPFLEHKNLRISPKVERVRGGSIFSGSSLSLIDPIDYKACEIPLK